MNTRNKIITGLAAVAIAAATVVGITGCHKEQHGDKYLSYAETAGKTVAYVINLSDKFTDKEVKAKVQEFLGKALPLIPTELTPGSIKVELYKIRDAVMAEIDIPEAIKPMVNTAVDVLLDFAYVGLEKIAAKYETECANADIYYKIVHTFISTVDATLGRLDGAVVASAAKDAKDPYSYDVASTVIEGLDKTEYEDLVEALLKK